MTAARLAAVFMVVLCTSSAQPRLHALVTPAAAPVELVDTLRLLAVRVEFVRDSDPTTFGDGTFLLSPDDRYTIDPPPHNAQYFETKLEFAKNYFARASGGRLNVIGTLLDSVIRVSKPMKEYAPGTLSPDLRKLALLAAESWRLADSAHPSAVFSEYDAFILFHAGSGRDIDLVSLLGFNPTPNDLPSITFDSSGFARALADPAFAGLPVDGGSFHITNTLILPETESRIVQSGGQDVVLKLGMNGLLVSSVGSRLGLPDLFNTSDGTSGIGQFGLMDGSSIFAYFGLFPPFPSAWERIQLGWTVPVEVPAAQQSLSIPAFGLYPSGIDTVFKIPISANEYYLVENRTRDIRGNGQLLHLVRADGSRDSVRYVRDVVGFNVFDVDSIRGSIVDVEDFDWAIPGSIDSTRLYDGGGILIWHIDERVIESKRASNTINEDPERRGIDLEEADGSEDIGQSYDTFTAGSGTENGSPLDCWYKHNPSPAYKNRFDRTTTPNSNSQTGAATLVTLQNFSERRLRMTMDVATGNDLLAPAAGFPKDIPGLSKGLIAFQQQTGGPASFVVAQDNPGARGRILGWTQQGVTALPNGSGNGILAEVDAERFNGPLALYQSQNAPAYLAAVADGIYLWRFEDNDSDGRLDLVAKIPMVPGERAAIMFADSLLVGAFRDSLTVFSLSGSAVFRHAGPTWDERTPMCRLGAEAVVVARGDSLTWFDLRGREIARLVRVGEQITGMASGMLFAGDSLHLVVRTSRGVTILNEAGVVRSRWSTTAAGIPGAIPLLVSLDAEPAKEIVFADSTGGLIAYHWNGTVAEGFPLQFDTTMTRGYASLVAVDRGAMGFSDLIVLDDAGDIRWWRNTGRGGTVTRIAAGSGAFGQIALVGLDDAQDVVGMVIADEAGQLRSYRTTIPFSESRMTWPAYAFDMARTASTPFEQSGGSAGISTILVPERTYNWPNPAYGSTTQIRYASTLDARVMIRVIDIAGRKLAEFETQATAGTDEEVTWNLESIQSGVYFATVEATAGGRTESRILKIAVVK